MSSSALLKRVKRLTRVLRWAWMNGPYCGPFDFWFAVDERLKATGEHP